MSKNLYPNNLPAEVTERAVTIANGYQVLTIAEYEIQPGSFSYILSFEDRVCGISDKRVIKSGA